jgi:hypothetical protein
MSVQGSQAGAPSWDRATVFLVLCLWVLVRTAQVKYLGTGVGFDVGLYQQYAQQFGSGSAPYVDFQPEYPAGALPVFLLAHLWAGPANYSTGFAVEMACFDLAACLLVLLTTRIGVRPGSLRPLLSALLYIAITAALFPVLYTRFDLVPGTLVLGAIYCHRLRGLRWAGVLLGAAGAVKLWPFALVPLFVMWHAKRKGFRSVVAAGTWVAIGAVGAAAPLLPRAGMAVFGFLKYHAMRGIQLETTWATVSLILGKLGVAEVQPEHNFGAFHVAGKLPSVLATLSLPLTVLFALAPQIVALVQRFREREESDRAFEHAALATVLGFMIAGKVLSPQFMLWIAPLLPLAVEGPAGAIAALMIGGLTTAVYPYLSPALEQREPGQGWALLAVGTRNLLLIGWYFTYFLRSLAPFRWGRSSFAGARLPAPAPSQE